MNTILLAGGLLVAGLFVLDRLVPRPTKIGQEEYERIGFKKAKIGERCVEDTNCEGYSTIGGDVACRQGKCDSFVKTDSLGQVKYAAYDLGLPLICNKKYLLGVGMVCTSDAQCSADGNLYEATDPRALSATSSSKHYCANNGECKQKIKDWAGIYWKQEDPLAPPQGYLGARYDPSNYDNVVRTINQQRSDCAIQLRSQLK